MGKPVRSLLLLFAVILCSASLCSCSPGYVIRAAYEESKILANRQDISDALLDPSISDEHKDKLRFVQEARDFASTLGLNPQKTFTKYSAVNRDVLSWVVMGCKKDSFTPHAWWFPIVGSVPYKGYFDREDADEEARSLESEGYETWVRGTDAFSTLGWFNDPVLTTTLKNPTTSIVNTVIHEITHSTFWFKGSVEFNETLANFIGTQGAALFFREKAEQCGSDTSCSNRYKKYIPEADLAASRTPVVSSFIASLYDALNGLYTSSKTSEEKIAERQSIFDTAIAPLRTTYPTMKSFRTLNNAEIMQVRIYLTHYDFFQTAFDKAGRDLRRFTTSIRDIHSEYTRGEPADPYLLITEK